MGFWDKTLDVPELIEMGFAVVGFFFIMSKVIDYVKLKGGAYLFRQCLWFVVSIGWFVVWLAGVVYLIKSCGFIIGVVGGTVVGVGLPFVMVKVCQKLGYAPAPPS